MGSRPFQDQQGQLSYFYLGGTSMASPHVAGIAALMAQKYNALTAAQAEDIITKSALPLRGGSRNVYDIDAKKVVTYSWGDDAAGSGLARADQALAQTP